MMRNVVIVQTPSTRPQDRPVVARFDRLNSTLSLDERPRDARVVEVTLTVAHPQ
jgi:hypothetical protein